MTHAKNIEKLGELIKNVRIAMFTTATRGGTLRSRPMATQTKKFDGTLWFFTDKDAAKVQEIRGDKHVNIAYADPKRNTYVSVSGIASMSNDKLQMRGLWNPAVQAWYPKGLRDPKLALIEVKVTQAEYWDAHSSKAVLLFEYAKAILTRTRPSGYGENRKLTISGPRPRPRSRRPRAAASARR